MVTNLIFQTNQNTIMVTIVSIVMFDLDMGCFFLLHIHMI